MGIPEMGYVIVKRDDPFTDGQAISFDDLGWIYIEMSRPDAGQFAARAEHRADQQRRTDHRPLHQGHGGPPVAPPRSTGTPT
jgi:hypothetical protein